MPKHSYFQEMWPSNSQNKLWIVGVKDTKIGKYSVCKSGISLSNMCCSALDDHARGKKHSKKSKEKKKMFTFVL